MSRNDISLLAVAVATAVAAKDYGAARGVLNDLSRNDMSLVAVTLGRFYIEGIRTYANKVGQPQDELVPAVLRDLGGRFAADPSP